MEKLNIFVVSSRLNVLIFVLTALCFLSGYGFSEEEELPISRDYYQVGDWENDLGYSQAVKVGNVIFVSGTRAAGKSMVAQMKTIYMRLQSVLGRYGATMNSITQERIYTTDLEQLKSLSKVRKQFYNSGVYPAVSWVQVEALADESALLEIELVVVVD